MPVKINNIIFKSNTNAYMYVMLLKNGIDFEMDKKLTLIEGFEYNGEEIPPIEIVIDFIIYTNKKIYIVFTKKVNSILISILKIGILSNFITTPYIKLIYGRNIKKQIETFVGNIISQ